MSLAESGKLRVAVSGASGLVGSVLCEKLSANYELLRFTRPTSTSVADSVTQQIEWVPSVGVRQPESMEDLHGIVHLAGRSIASARWTDREKEKIRNSRVEATQKLVAQICKLNRRPKVFVCASAIGIYGETGSEPVDEMSPLADDFLGSVAKEWEAACLPLQDLGVRVCHARLGIVLDKSGGALGKMLPLFKWMVGGVVGDGSQFWSWVALEDCVRAIEWMLETKSANGPYNVVSPNAVTNRTFTIELAKALGKPAFLPAPKFGLRLALGEMADALLLASCNVVPRRLLEAGFTFSQPDLAEYFDAELNRR